MDEKVITKSVYRKNKETGKRELVEITYRQDAEFVPTSIKEICAEFMVNYCIAKGEEHIKWLKDLYEKTEEKSVVGKDGKEGKITVRAYNDRQIVVLFAHNYFPKCIKKNIEPKPEPNRTKRIADLEKALEAKAKGNTKTKEKEENK
jgi:hypothetical protein